MSAAVMRSRPCTDRERGPDRQRLAPIPAQHGGRCACGGGCPRCAAAAVRDAHGPMPFLDRLQPLFGHHDLRSIRAAIGGQAALRGAELGAEALTLGERVAFRQPPTILTAAHEATHVIQQRLGHRPPGGVGAVGDALERSADAIASQAARGLPVAAALDRLGRRGPPTRALQRQASPLACAGLVMAGERQRVNGVRAHAAISQAFVDEVGEHAIRLCIPNAAFTGFRSEGCSDETTPSCISPVTYNPNASRSGVGIPDLVYWEPQMSRLELAEIKPATWSCVCDAELQVLNYMTKGNRDEGEIAALRERAGVDRFALMHPSRFSAPAVIVDGTRVVTSWCSDGVLVYKAVSTRDEEDEERRRREAASARLPRVTRLASPHLRTLFPDLDGAVQRRLGRILPGRRYVLLVPPAIYEDYVAKPFEAEHRRLFDPGTRYFNPRISPVHGLRNLGTRLNTFVAAGYALSAVGVSLGVSLQPVTQVGAAARTGSGTASATSLTAASRTSSRAITSLQAARATRAAHLAAAGEVVTEAAAGGLLYVLVAPETAYASPRRPSAEESVIVVPADAVEGQTESLGFAVRHRGATYRVVGFVSSRADRP